MFWGLFNIAKNRQKHTKINTSNMSTYAIFSDLIFQKIWIRTELSNMDHRLCTNVFKVDNQLAEERGEGMSCREDTKFEL